MLRTEIYDRGMGEGYKEEDKEIGESGRCIYGIIYSGPHFFLCCLSVSLHKLRSAFFFV